MSAVSHQQIAAQVAVAKLVGTHTCQQQQYRMPYPNSLVFADIEFVITRHQAVVSVAIM